MSQGEVQWDALAVPTGAVVDTTQLAGLQPTDEGGIRRLKKIPALNIFTYLKTKFGTAAQEDNSAFLETADFPSDTAWTTVTSLLNGWTGTIYYIKRAGVVTVTVNGIINSSATNVIFFALPPGYTPDILFRGNGLTTTTDPREPAIFDVFPSGSIRMNYGTTIGTFYGQVSFPVL